MLHVCEVFGTKTWILNVVNHILSCRWEIQFGIKGTQIHSILLILFIYILRFLTKNYLYDFRSSMAQILFSKFSSPFSFLCVGDKNYCVFFSPDLSTSLTTWRTTTMTNSNDNNAENVDVKRERNYQITQTFCIWKWIGLVNFGHLLTEAVQQRRRRRRRRRQQPHHHQQ